NPIDTVALRSARRRIAIEEAVLGESKVHAAVRAQRVVIVATQIRFEQKIAPALPMSRKLDRAKAAKSDRLQKTCADCGDFLGPIADAETGDSVIGLVLADLPPSVAKHGFSPSVEEDGAHVDMTVTAGDGFLEDHVRYISRKPSNVTSER